MEELLKQTTPVPDDEILLAWKAEAQRRLLLHTRGLGECLTEAEVFKRIGELGT